MKYITTRELADRWSVSVGTLRNWRSQDKGPSYMKLENDRVAYSIKDIENYEKNNMVRSRKSNDAKA